MKPTSRANSPFAAFRYAFSGLAYVLRSQRNARLHAIATVLALLISFLLHLPTHSWALIIFAIGLVWMAEFLNTALEAVVDLASPDLHPLARVGKDVGAAAVLIAALTAAVIGLLIFGPPLLDLLF